MPTQLPIPPDARSPYGPDGVPKTFSDVTHRVRRAADHLEHADEPAPTAAGVDLGHPLLKLAAAAFVGYTLGRLVHRRSREAPSLPPAPARMPYRPGATEPYRVQPIRDRPSVRYR